jgi:RHS repeat-associated protein
LVDGGTSWVAVYNGTNAHGDLTWTASTNGSVISTAAYDPFGKLLAHTGSLPANGWQGSLLDGASGLYYVVARWHSPALGRFLSVDPQAGSADNPQSLDRYAYGAGDSIGRTDTNGRCAVSSTNFGACSSAAQVSTANAQEQANLDSYNQRLQAQAEADARAVTQAREADAAARQAQWQSSQQPAVAAATAILTSGCHPDGQSGADLCAAYGTDAGATTALAQQESIARAEQVYEARAIFQAMACAGSGNYAGGCRGPEGVVLEDVALMTSARRPKPSAPNRPPADLELGSLHDILFGDAQQRP